MFERLNKLTWLLMLVLVGACVGGCSRESRIDRHLQRAETAFDAGNYEEAEIEYLNVLHLDKTNSMAVRNLGVMAFEQGRLSRAFRLLGRAKEMVPDDFEIRLKLARCLLAGGEPGPAREETLELVAIQPTNQEALLLLVDASFDTDQLDDARQRLQNLSSVAEGTPGFHLALGMIQFRRQELQSAEQSFRKAMSLDPDSSAVHAAMGHLFLAAKDGEKAESEFKTAARLAPTRSPHRLRYADFLLSKGDVSNARKCLEEIIKQAPDYLPAHGRLARIALDEGRFEDCEAEIGNALRRDPDNLDAMLLLVKLRLAQDKPDRAISELERMRREHPGVAQFRYLLAAARLKANDESGALNELREALALQPDYPEAEILRAELNIRRGEAGLAVVSLSKLIEQHPKLPEAYLKLATAHRATGDIDAALGVYSTLDGLDPGNPRIASLAGSLLKAAHRNDEARKWFEKAITADPNYLPAIEQLAALDVAEERYARARGRVEKALSDHPEEAGLHLLLATIHLAETNLVSAESAALKAVECKPDTSSAQILLSRILSDMGKRKEALDRLRRFASQNTNDIAAWLQIGQLNLAATNYAAASDAYERILKVDPDFVPALNNLAWIYGEQSIDLQRAEELARRAHDLRPLDPFTTDTFGWVLFHRGQYSHALALLKQSAESLPQSAEARFHLGMTHYMLGDEAEARIALERALQLSPIGEWRAAALEHVEMLETSPSTTDAHARVRLERRLASHPNDPVVLARLAAIYEREGEYAKAAAAFENLLKMRPEQVSIIMNLASLYFETLHQPGRARELAINALSLSPTDPEVSYLAGRIAYAEGDHKWAASLLEECSRLLPDNPEVAYNFGLAAYSVGRIEDALNAFQKALDGGLPSPHDERARDYLRLSSLWVDPGRMEKLSVELPGGLNSRTNLVPALMIRAEILEQRGEYSSARDQYDSVLKEMPNFSLADKKLATICFDHLNDVPRAYDHARKARAAFPDDPQVSRILGLIACQREEYAAAVRLLTECSLKLKTDAEVFYQLGICQLKLSRKQESVESLNRVLALAPDSSHAAEAKRLLQELN